MKFNNILLKVTLVFSFSFFYTSVNAQEKRLTRDMLAARHCPGWDDVMSIIGSSINEYKILPVEDSAKAVENLYDLQISTRQHLGAIIYKTGGIVVDHGWIRIFGSGSVLLNRNIVDYSIDKGLTPGIDKPKGMAIIADDVLGGFYAINYGDLGVDINSVYYFGADGLSYERMNMTYREFLVFCFNTKLDNWYDGYRWNNWQKEIPETNYNQSLDAKPRLYDPKFTDLETMPKNWMPVLQLYKEMIAKKK
jgi:Protein of unknown function DUF2625